VTGYQKAKAIYAGYPTKNRKEGVAEGEVRGEEIGVGKGKEGRGSYSTFLLITTGYTIKTRQLVMLQKCSKML